MNLWNLSLGLGNCVVFKKLRQLAYQNNYLTLFPKPIIYTILAGWKMLQHLTAELMFSSALFPHYNIRMEQTWKENTTVYSWAFFQKCLIKDWSASPKVVYNTNDPNSLKLLTRLRLGPSHLNEHKFNHSFKECVNPLSLFPICFFFVCSFVLFFCFFCTVSIHRY